MKRPTNIYPCNGRERITKPYIVQNGYHEFEQNGVMVRGAPRYEWITTEFKLDHKCVDRERDPKCQGCGHRQCVQSSGG